MDYSVYVAGRISAAKSGGARNPAVGVAVAAVAISVAVMLLSVAIVLGFKGEIRDKVVGFNSHLTVYPKLTENDPENVVTLNADLINLLRDVPFVKDYNLQGAIPAVLKTSNDFKGIYLKGTSGEDSKQFLKRNLVYGNIPEFRNDTDNNKVVLSQKASIQLGLSCGDKIDTYFISDDVRVRRLEIDGIFNTHFDQYDDVLAFGSLGLVQKLGSIKSNQGTYIQVLTDNFNNVARYSAQLQQTLDKAYESGRVSRQFRVDNVLMQGAGFFSWLALLDTNVVVIIILMLVVGIVTLVSGLIIIILEKKRFIGIMRAMGASTYGVRKIFLLLALRVAIYGMLIGNAVALALMFVQERTHFMPLDADSYYIDFVPVRINFLWIAVINAGVLIVTYLSLIMPSRFVAKISPAETMRGEE